MTISSRAALLALALLAGSCSGDVQPGPIGTPTSADPTATGTPSPVPGPRAASWERLASAGLERLEVAAGVVDGRLIVAGGFGPGPGRVTGAVEIYDPEANAWRRGPDLPLPVHHAMGAAFDGTFVVLGGFAAEGFTNPSRRVFALRGARWEELPPMRRARAAGGAGAVGDVLVVAGGQDGDALIRETEVFDGVRWRDGANIPTVRDHLAAASDGSALYVAGGRTMSIAAVVPAFESYDPATDRWTRLPGMPTPRGGTGAAFVADSIVVVGGEGSAEDAGEDGVFEHVEAFDIASGSWRTLTAMRTPRHGIGVAALDGTIFVAAGGRRAGFTHTPILESITLA